MSQEKLKNAKNLFFIALGIDMVVTALVVVTDFWAVGVLNDIRSGITTADQSTISTLEFWESFAKVMIVTLIGVGLALVRWLDACYEYAKESIKATGFAQEGWKTWGWIFPFMNVFKPYQVLSEIYKVSATDHDGGEEWKRSSGSGMLLIWWIFWVITHMIMWGIGKQALKSGAFRDDLTLNQIIGMYYSSVTVCVVSLIVAGLWFVVVGNLTRRLLSRSTPVVVSVAPARAHAAYLSEFPVVGNLSKAVPPESYNTIPLQTIVDEEPIYAEISNELETGVVDKGLWTRLFAECGGDEKQTKVLYIQERVKRLVAAECLRLEQAAVESASTSARVEVSKLTSAYVLGNTLTAEELARLARASSIDPSISTLRDKIRGKTLLHWCARLGLENEAAILIANGADPNAPDGNGRRAFEGLALRSAISSAVDAQPIIPPDAAR